jgi:FdhD protein
MVQMYRKLSCIRFDGEQAESTTHEVVEEVPMAFFINGRHAMTAMMSPQYLEEFVTGYLFTEQIIRNPDEIESVKIEKNRISVITKNLFKMLGPKKTILSGCGGSSSYIDPEKLPKITSGFVISTKKIQESIRIVLDSELHRTTGGIHVVALLDKEKILFLSEDIGRHNALDRAIGFGLRNNIDFSQTFVVSSGRISSEMVRKCLIAQIPVIISRSATTTLAVEIAQKTNLTVIGFARGAKMNVYTHPERIVGAEGARARSSSE